MNGCCQNESPNSWSKHHNNPQVIHSFFLQMQLLNLQDVNWWTGLLDYLWIIKIYLVSKWCNAKFLQICSVPMNKQTHLHLGWPEVRIFLANFNFSMQILDWYQIFFACHMNNQTVCFWFTKKNRLIRVIHSGIGPHWLSCNVLIHWNDELVLKSL